MLDAHRLFRRQEQFVAVDRRRKPHTLLADLAQVAQRKHLEAARVGQDRTVPAHEAMQPAVRRDHLQPGPQPEMESIAEDNRRADADQFVRGHGFHRAIGAHRHESRRWRHAVRQCQRSASRSAVRGEQFEVHIDLRCSSMASP